MGSMRLWRWIGLWAMGAAIGLAVEARGDAARAALPGIEGSWMSSCYVQNGQSLKRDLYIVSSQIFSAQSLYADAGCFDLKIKLEEVQGYESDSSELLPGATNVDLVAQRSFLTVFDAETARLWEAAKFCGIAAWDVGIPKDVTGKNCGGHVMAKTGDRQYDLYLKESETRLWIGLRSATLDGSTPGKRPQLIDRTVSFRQLGE